MGHLEEAELARLLEKFRQEPDAPLDLAELHPHLASCGACREQFEELSALDRQIKSMKTGESTVQANGCPSAEVWRQIAGGLTSPGLTLTCIEHASRCYFCGPLLR